MRRELDIALRARITWLVAALSALLVGHGFVLAVDVFSAGSRSAAANALQAREMDPLAGIVRPTLGGLELAVSVLVPLVAARVLSVEKERRTFGVLCLLEGSSDRVVLRKLVAAFVAAGLCLATPLVLFVAFRVVGGHIDVMETGLAVSGATLHLALVMAVSVAAAAWTRTLAQAATLAVAVSLASWAVDAADGFAALAWLGDASAWSIDRRLEPLQRGIVSLGSLAWLGSGIAAAAALATIGARFDLSPVRRTVWGVAVAVAAASVMLAAGHSRRAYDWTEQRRASLPPAAVAALRALPVAPALRVLLDRDDSRRRQLEADVLAKLFLARPDLAVETPLDHEPRVAEGTHGEDYGRVLVRVGAVTRETRSMSRREIVTLILEAGGAATAGWSQPDYPGFPTVVEGAKRAALLALSYVIVPAALLGIGFGLTRRRILR